MRLELGRRADHVIRAAAAITLLDALEAVDGEAVSTGCVIDAAIEAGTHRIPDDVLRPGDAAPAR